MAETLRALLVGIDDYLTKPKLQGCVRDVGDVEAFLRARLGVPSEHIVKLTATNPRVAPVPPDERKPTYRNLTAALLELLETARAGEQVYLHYAGHGARPRTQFPEVKGAGGFDEALVPCDLGSPASRYLLDVELAYLLKQMVDKGLVVTLVLDCCHSGGLTRYGDDDGIRGLGTDEAPPPAGDAIAPRAALAGTLAAGAYGADRYVVLAACQAHELANEYAFDGKRRQGVLTYAFLRALGGAGGAISFEALRNRVVAEVHARYPSQTPTLEGDAARVVFGSSRLAYAHGIGVLGLDAAKRVRLDAGLAHGLGVGSQLRVHAPDAVDLSVDDPDLPRLEIVEVTAVESRARLRSGPLPRPGALAVVARRDLSRRRGVRLAGDTPTLRALAALLRDDDLVSPSEARVDFEVRQSAAGLVEICDPGGTPLPHLRPPVLANADAPLETARRLRHLARWNDVRALRNEDANHPLVRGLRVELLAPPDRAPPAWPVVIPPDARRLPGVLTVDDGTPLYLRVANDTERPIFVTVLDLVPGWGIQKLAPRDREFQSVDAHAAHAFAFGFQLPRGYDEGTDVLKVLATFETTRFDWLTLPRLDVGGRPPDLPPQPLGGDWAAADVEVHIRKERPCT
jgi:hypothetical protein